MDFSNEQALIYARELRVLYEVEQRKATRLKALLDLSGMLTSLTNLDRLLCVALQRALEFSRCCSGYILLVSPGGKSLKVACSVGGREEFDDAEENVSDFPVALYVMKAGQPAQVRGREGHRAHGERRFLSEEGTSVVLPLVTPQTGPLGVLALNSSVDLQPLPEEDVQTLVMIAGQVAIAIENSRLFADLQRKRAELQVVLQKLIRAQEEERRKVAHDLHDGLLQIMVGAHQSLETYVSLPSRNSAETRQWLERGKELLKQSIGEGRKVIAGLRPSLLDDHGLVAAVRAYLQLIGASEHWEVELIDELRGFRPPAEVEVTLYRIAQEAINNADKHAHTQKVQIVLRRADGELLLQVKDWGRGFEPLTKLHGAGVGLAGMHERATLIGGRLTVESRPGEGTCVRIQVPLNDPAEAMAR